MRRITNVEKSNCSMNNKSVNKNQDESTIETIETIYEDSARSAQLPYREF